MATPLRFNCKVPAKVNEYGARGIYLAKSSPNVCLKWHQARRKPRRQGAAGFAVPCRPAVFVILPLGRKSTRHPTSNQMVKVRLHVANG
jgi:hypothetical protein